MSILGIELVQIGDWTCLVFAPARDMLIFELVDWT